MSPAQYIWGLTGQIPYIPSTCNKDRCQSRPGIVINKLAETSWGASAQILRWSAVGLCYSVAEYCIPACGRSSHVKMVDRQLNETMRIVLGLFVQLHSSGFQFYPTLFLQPSDVPKPPPSLSMHYIQTKPPLPVYSDVCIIRRLV